MEVGWGRADRRGLLLSRLWAVQNLPENLNKYLLYIKQASINELGFMRYYNNILDRMLQ